MVASRTRKKAPDGGDTDIFFSCLLQPRALYASLTHVRGEKMF